MTVSKLFSTPFLTAALVSSLLGGPSAAQVPQGEVLVSVSEDAGAPSPRTAGRPLDYSKIRSLSQPRYKDVVRESFEVEMEDGINI